MDVDTSGFEVSLIFTCTSQVAPSGNFIPQPGPKKPRTTEEEASSTVEELTSKDYYFDSYSHFSKPSALACIYVLTAVSIHFLFCKAFTRKC